MSEPYNHGGVLPAPEPMPVVLHPDECVVQLRETGAVVCVRASHHTRPCRRGQADPTGDDHSN